MKAVSAETMRYLDQQTIQDGYCSGWELMCRAGWAVAGEILQLLESPEKYSFCIVTGKGNNAGDGFVIAQYLYTHVPGADIQIHSLCPDPAQNLKGDALTAFCSMDKTLAAQVKFSLDAEDLKPDTVVIDAILGTGFSGELKAEYRQWIGKINQADCPVFSVDIPSGLSADNGEVQDVAVRADCTITIALPKCGMLLGKGPEYCGKILVCSIGIPDALIVTVEDHLQAVHSSDAALCFPPEAWNSFKNQKGHVLVVGGSADYPGAPFLSGEAALRTGAGLVTVAVPGGTPLFFEIPKALIVRQINTGKSCDPVIGFYAAESAEQIAALAEKMQTVAIGPGLAKNAQTAGFLKALLPLIKTVLVLDADALNIIAENPDLFQYLNERTILTPHPGEMARLMRAAGLDYQNLSRTQQAAALAQYTGSTVVLKGPGTVIAAADGRVAVNLSGSPELATAGSGDLLTGIISAVSAHGYAVFESACAGVYLHGMLGDLCCPGKTAMEQGAGIIADDLLLQIGNAIMKLRKKGGKF